MTGEIGQMPDPPRKGTLPVGPRETVSEAAPGTANDNLFAILPVPESLLDSPIDYLFAESCRTLRFCDILEMVAADTGRIGRLAAPALIGFLRTDLPRHIDEMEKEVLPLVEGALLVGDDADGALAQLSREHAVDRRRAEQLIDALESLRAGEATDDGREAALLALAFAEAQRRHVAWEKAVLYPLAHVRLHPRLLRSLSRRLAVRRKKGSS